MSYMGSTYSWLGPLHLSEVPSSGASSSAAPPGPTQSHSSAHPITSFKGTSRSRALFFASRASSPPRRHSTRIRYPPSLGTAWWTVFCDYTQRRLVTPARCVGLKTTLRFATPNGLPHGFLTILIVEVGVAALARIARVRTHHIDPDYLKPDDFCLPNEWRVFLQLHKHLTGLDSHVYSRCRVFRRHLIQPSRNRFGEESVVFTTRGIENIANTGVQDSHYW
ncbi:hypothetical protein VTO73DRAFT_15310 [Trametes versicolor]